MAFGLLASPGLAATADLFDRVPTFMLLRPRYGEGEVIARHILELRERSPAFRGLLDVLETHSDLRVLVAPMDGPACALLGWTTLAADTSGLVASMHVRVDFNHPEWTVRALAHEFAHVLESVCIADGTRTADLKRRLIARASSTTMIGQFPAYETRFAEAYGREILRDRTRKHSSATASAQVNTCARFDVAASLRAGIHVPAGRDSPH